MVNLNPLRDRTTTDIVVILLTSLVGAFVLILLLGVVIGKLTNPDVDIRSAVELLGNIVTTVVGAVVGFIGGRAAGRAEANGPK